METSFEQSAVSAQCPTCGSSLERHATTCAACGTPLAIPVSVPPAPETSAASPEATPASPQIASADASADASPVTLAATAATAPAAPAAPASSDQKRCDWCGAENPLDADRCIRCNAMFPRPELDEAMRRAGEARIQVAQDEIALRQRVRKWYSLSRLFGS